LNNAFNVQEQKLREKFYEKHWFYWLMFAVAIVIVIMIVVLTLLHEL
jgi:uncharacterized membrane protein YidH (DUF202 family)